MTEVKAKLNYLHNTPRKTRAIAQVIKGLSVGEAEARLMLSPRRASAPLRKLLRSAAANATHAKVEREKLFIKEIRVDQGPYFVKYMPRAQGRVTPIKKKMSHVTIVLGIWEASKPSRFTVQERPAKEKKEKKEKAKYEAEAVEEAEEKKPDYIEKEPLSAPKVKKTKGPGMIQRMFRRKSI